MFRYGGPIKEGVMHGMKNGGSMSNNQGPRRAALVGNPIYPQTSGREHHLAPLAIGAGLARVLPWAARGAKAAWKYMKPTSVPKYKALTGKLYKEPFTYGKMSGLERTGKWMKANPGYTLTGGLAAYNAPGTYGAVKGAGGLGWKALKQAADLAVPDWIWDQDKWEKERAEKMKPPTGIIKPGGFEKIINEEKKIIKSAEELAAEAKAARTKKLNKYLDTMGYDKAKKTAMGDALIDASAIVQDATTEAGSLKKADWGKLINRMIQTTSKRLDKPEQIREAVGLMMTKGEIEKDILEAKGSPQRQMARDLVAAGVYKTEKEALSKLANVGSFEETMTALAAKTGKVTGDILKLSWMTNPANTNNTPPRDHFKSTDKVYKDYKEAKEDANDDYNVELEFVKDNIDDRQPGDAYVVDDSLIIVNSDGTLDYKWKS